MKELPDHMTLSNKTSYQTQAFPVQATVKFRIHCGRGFNKRIITPVKKHGSLDRTP